MLCRDGVKDVRDFDQLIPVHMFHAILDDVCEFGLGSLTMFPSQRAQQRLPLFSFPCPSHGLALSHVGCLING
jgi:isocitrate/isopropylmalate dehydrogenase